MSVYKEVTLSYTYHICRWNIIWIFVTCTFVSYTHFITVEFVRGMLSKVDMFDVRHRQQLCIVLYKIFRWSVTKNRWINFFMPLVNIQIFPFRREYPHQTFICIINILQFGATGLPGMCLLMEARCEKIFKMYFFFLGWTIHHDAPGLFVQNSRFEMCNFSIMP